MAAQINKQEVVYSNITRERNLSIHLDEGLDWIEANQSHYTLLYPIFNSTKDAIRPQKMGT